MATYICQICQFHFEEKSRGIEFNNLDSNWTCPECGAFKGNFVRQIDDDDRERKQDSVDEVQPDVSTDSSGVDVSHFFHGCPSVPWLEDIMTIAQTGQSLEDNLLDTSRHLPSWDEILLLGNQLNPLPLLADEKVVTQTIIGPNAEKPLILDSPLLITHMSFGSLSREAKLALAQASALAGTAIGSGEGGILPKELSTAGKYIFEVVPNLYSVTPENLQKVDAVELKFGQAAMPGLGSSLPGDRVTEEIGQVRGLPAGQTIHNPSRFPDIHTPKELADKIDWLRNAIQGRPVGVKIAAGHLEEDLDFILEAKPDFITVDGAPGGAAIAPKYLKMGVTVPTIYALVRAKRHLMRCHANKISLIITGGLRISPDFAKAMALGADAIAIGTSALMAMNSPQNCPLDINSAARRVANFLKVSTEELTQFARLTGHLNVHDFSPNDLCTISREISETTGIRHA